MKDGRGFLLIEVLIAVLLLSTVLTALGGVFVQCLKISKREKETMQALLYTEPFLFQLETGQRAGWIRYGGQESAGTDGNVRVGAGPEPGDFRTCELNYFKNRKSILNLELWMKNA
jgi:type II secretory pathway pseudopilin PulG